MSTPSPYQPLLVLDSAAADGHFTRIKIDPNEASLVSVGMHPRRKPGTTVFEFPFSPPSSETAPAPASLPLFLIQFTRYDLVNNQLYNGAKQEIVSYSVDPKHIRDGLTFVTVVRTASVSQIIYDNVQPAHSHSDNVTDPLPDPLDPIKVVLTFSAPGGPEVSGWINLDISYTHPTQFLQTKDKSAWEATLYFPQARIDRTTVVREGLFDESLTKDWSVLLPGGDAGKIEGIAVPQYHDMPVQLAALYKSDPGTKFLRAVALMGTDVLGHKKVFAYERRDATVDPDSDALGARLVSSMHLLNKQYAQPVDPKNPKFNFTLSSGDEYGYGGARTFFRIRALQVNAEQDTPLDWTDVASVYRKWAKVRRPGFFTKAVPRDPNAKGPVDTMSPTTAITNYGLDGPLSPTSTNQALAKWLEIHPVKVEGKTDVAGNTNVSLQDRLAEMRRRLDNSRNELKLEAQIWGYELGGYYQWVAGYPPITSVLSNVTGKPDRFRAAMDELAAKSIFASITTDFYKPLFNRLRFGGHVVKNASGKWVEAITEPFPAAFTDPGRNINVAGGCKIVTSAKLYNDPEHPSAQDFTLRNRVFLLKKNEREILPESQPNCPDAETLCRYPQLGPDGIVGGGAVLGNRFYQQQLLAICPQDDVLRIYLDKCLNKGAFRYGARLIEYMKPNFDFCYDKSHKHIFTGVTNVRGHYDNAIGYGPWVTARIQQVLTKIQRLGQGLDPRADGVRDATFALTREFVPFEPMLRYFNEYYGRSPVLQHVYGEAISVKVSPGFVAAPYRHPGYKERKKQTAPPYAPPSFMLTSDVVSQGALPTPESLRVEARKYFDANFEVASHGIAPRNYRLMGSTATYTYNRCVEDVLNLKSFFFSLGESTVLGERLHVPSIWFDAPTDPNEEAIRMAARATHLHLRFARFLRGGYLLGKTKILSNNRELYAWRVGVRNFDDAEDLKAAVPRPAGLGIGSDFISRGVDKDEYFSPRSSPRIQHMIWQRATAAGLQTLYLFANVGNTATPLKFMYTRGLDSTTGWKKLITVFDGRNSLGVDRPAAPVTLGSTEQGFVQAANNLAPRSFAAVVISK